MREFLWCFDDGMKQSPQYAGVRLSHLLEEIKRLSRTYTPALDALRERRDKAKVAFAGAENDRSAFVDFSFLNKALDEDRLTLETYDKLLPQDVRRRQIGNLVFDLLLEARRYSDALEAQPPRQFVDDFDRMRTMFERAVAEGKMPAEIMQAQNRSLSQSGAGEIEALAGAGRLDEARTLIVKLQAIDASAETRDILRAHLQRAGHAELIPAASARTQ